MAEVKRGKQQVPRRNYAILVLEARISQTQADVELQDEHLGVLHASIAKTLERRTKAYEELRELADALAKLTGEKPNA